jgi:hypothetical protein
MNRTLAALIAPVLAATALSAHADAYDCFPLCPEAAQQAATQAPLNLCDHAAVREAAKVDRKLAPVKRLYSIATNPTGFAIEQVSDRTGVHIPAWVGYVADPKGAIRSKVMEKARELAKKEVGLQDSCATEIVAEAETQGAEAP